MTERTEAINGVTSDIPLVQSSATPMSTSTALSRAERMAVIEELQRQALRAPNAWAANVGVLTGDLLHITAEFQRCFQASPLQNAVDSGPGFQALCRRAELLLKFVRQIDRLAHLSRNLAAGPSDDSK
jgi:hypothetical protein